jgi:hypothetical protein
MALVANFIPFSHNKLDIIFDKKTNWHEFWGFIWNDLGDFFTQKHLVTLESKQEETIEPKEVESLELSA